MLIHYLPLTKEIQKGCEKSCVFEKYVFLLKTRIMALTTLNLTIDLSFSADKTELILEDTTGTYNATLNPYGYGSTNGIAINDVDSLIITLNYTPLTLSAVYAFTISSGTITAATIDFNSLGAENILSQLDSTTFPFTSANPFTFFNSYVDGSSNTYTMPELEDGAYSVSYEITGTASDNGTPTAFDLTTTKMILQTLTTQCCLDEKFNALSEDCTCDDTEAQKALRAYGYLLTAQIAVAEENSSRANTFINKAKSICDCDCGC